MSLQWVESVKDVLGWLVLLCGFAVSCGTLLHHPRKASGQQMSQSHDQLKAKVATALGNTAHVPCLYQSFETALLVLRTYCEVDTDFQTAPEVQEFMKLCKDFQTGTRLSFENKTVIVIEGIDATGKSTIVDLFAKTYGFTTAKTPSNTISHLRPFFDKQFPSIQRAFYTISNYLTAREIMDNPTSDRIIIDRYYDSTCAFTIGSQQDASAKPTHILALPTSLFEFPRDLPLPSITILLTCDDALRQLRIQRRQEGNTIFEERYTKQRGLADLVSTAYRRIFQTRRNCVAVVDTSIHTPSSIVQIIATNCRERTYLFLKQTN